MRLCIVVPSEDYLGQAGVRIRYNRIAPALQARGHELTLEVIDQIRHLKQLTHDAYLFSKCYDARSMLFAQLLRGSGRLVGVDLFDDYFSQHEDPRFVCHRDWLGSMGQLSDFFLCSTPRMLEVGREFMPDLPGHVLNDPYDAVDPPHIAATVARNRTAALASGRMDIAWFGMGDNPHFSVGLRDLHAFSHALSAMQAPGLTAKLSILTNRRALTADGLELLRRLPVPWTLQEWSVDAERELLANSLAAFLPVNCQNFSIAKSLNRAVSALTAGTQVLSPGYPLYAPLGEFVYADPLALVTDLQADRLKLRGETLDALGADLAARADPTRETAQFAAFVEDVLTTKRTAEPLRSATAQAPGLVGVIHGIRSLGATHQAAQRLKQLSIGTPFSVTSLHYDVTLALGEAGEVQVQLSDAAFQQIDRRHSRGWREGAMVAGRPQRMQALRQLLPDLDAPMQVCLAQASRPERLAAYGKMMRDMSRLLSALFPGITLLRSEGEAPFHSDVPAAGSRAAQEIRA